MGKQLYKVVAIGKNDAYKHDEDRFIGKKLEIVQVGEEKHSKQGRGGWYSGRMKFTETVWFKEEDTYRFYRIKLKALK